MADASDHALEHLVPSPEELRARLGDIGYLADDGIATALFCAARLPQPVLLEGEAGVGKTEASKALATVLGTPLIRLQCYEGIDAAEALYEWNYPRQLLAIRVAEARGRDLAEAINWAFALRLLGFTDLDAAAAEKTVGSVLKYREDIQLAMDRGLLWVATGG